MKARNIFLMIWAAAFVLYAGMVHAQTLPPVINYEGKLLDQNGNPVNGNLTMIFGIFDAATGDTALFSETQTIAVNDGAFHALIGSVTPIPQTLFDRVPPAGFLEITVNGTTLIPRRRFGSAAYAFYSGSANITSVNAGVGLAATANTGEVTLRIVDDGVTSGKILNGTIRAADLAANSVHSEEIGTGAVGASEIAADAVGSSEIAAGAVGSSEIADNAVTGSKIADGAVGSRALANLIDLGDANTGGNLQVYSAAMTHAACEILPLASGGGLLRTFDDNGDMVTELSRVDDSGAGKLWIFGPNGTFNVKLWDMSESSNPVPDYGSIDVCGEDGHERAGIFLPTSAIGGGGGDLGVGDGHVYGDTKNFRMTNPLAPDQEIWYASIEGPEAAAYVRGTARLTKGSAAITFPEHFQIVSAATNMTVRLTPLDASSKGLAVTRKSASGIEVQELRQGAGNYDFDWEVKCVRKGHDNFQVIRSKP